MKHLVYILSAVSLLAASCGFKPTKTKVPVYGKKEVLVDLPNGEQVMDSVTTLIDSFEVMDQDSQLITAANFEGKIYVVDFFFTHCPTICPVMTKNMYHLYEHFENDPNVLFLSHSIDIHNDSIPQLKKYAEKTGITSDRWHMVRASRSEIQRLAGLYMVAAEEDPNSPGGYMHSGAFVLMDGQHRIRGYYDGTEEEDTHLLIDDIALLKKEQNER
jgi:protein SCO1/2